MSDVFDSGKFGAIIGIPCTMTNATTGNSNTDLTFAGGGGTLWIAPVAGSVIGIGVQANASITAGTATFKAHSASTEVTDTGAPAPAISSAASGSYATAAHDVVAFSAGDTLGISVTTTTTLDPTNSLDIDAVLYVALDPT